MRSVALGGPRMVPNYPIARRFASEYCAATVRQVSRISAHRPRADKKEARNPLAARRDRVEFASFRPPRKHHPPPARSAAPCPAVAKTARRPIARFSARDIRGTLGNSTALVLEYDTSNGLGDSGTRSLARPLLPQRSLL